MTDEELFERAVEVAAALEDRAETLQTEGNDALGYRAVSVGRAVQALEDAEQALFDAMNIGRHHGGIDEFHAADWTREKKARRERHPF